MIKLCHAMGRGCQGFEPRDHRTALKLALDKSKPPLDGFSHIILAYGDIKVSVRSIYGQHPKRCEQSGLSKIIGPLRSVYC